MSTPHKDTFGKLAPHHPGDGGLGGGLRHADPLHGCLGRQGRQGRSPGPGV